MSGIVLVYRARQGNAASGPAMLDLYIDADACPVRREAFQVAERYALTVFVVTCGTVRVPYDPRIRLALVAEGTDAADDWIAERIAAGDICVTADVPLAG